ncbi:MAG: transposase, partial [archaeon]|nr:transposase [archaeon]
MAVPESIRKVERPKGTVVGDGHDGVYPVREKLSGTYYRGPDGKAHRPSRNGKVVGHIIDGVYVEKKTEDIPPVSDGGVDLKDWGNVELTDRLNRDVYDLLGTVYNQRDRDMLYTMAIMRASYRGIHDRMLERTYEESFLSETYPGLSLGRNSVSEFLRDVGRCCTRVTEVMRILVGRVECNEHVIVDGSLRQDHSRVNDLSDVSRKTSNRGYKEILLMYAYNLEKRVPLCSKVYPGNMVDQRAVSDFIEEFRISKGMIVADKGFPPESVKGSVRSRPDLHYLLPIKRGSEVIKELEMYRYDRRLPGDGGVVCKKASRFEGDKRVWYYSFRDPSIAMDEELLYTTTHKGADFDPHVLETLRPSFGTLVFESDTEMECEKVYETYSSRWLIEMFFRSQEDALEMDDTREHSDYSVIASNFVNFLASVMLSRLMDRFDKKGLLEKNTFGDVMHVLRKAKMVRTDREGGWKVCRMTVKDADLLVETGLFDRPVV